MHLEHTTEHLNDLPTAERPSPDNGRPILDITSGISTLQAVLTQVQEAVQHLADLEGILRQLCRSRSLKRDRAAQMSHVEEIVEHINAMDQKSTAEGHSVFGETADAPVVSLPDGSSVSLRPNRIHPLLDKMACQNQKDFAVYLETVKAQLKDIRAWQNYLLSQLDAFVQKLPFQGHVGPGAGQDAATHDAKALTQELTSLLVDQLLASDVLSLTRMGLLRGHRVAALLDDPTALHPTPCHLTVKSHDLNVN
jgi:hypothetical protein